MGMGWMKGDWKAAEKKTRTINLIEPVVEGTLQLFVQSILLYIVNGPGETMYATRYSRPLDLSSILYSKSYLSRIFYSFSFTSTTVR